MEMQPVDTVNQVFTAFQRIKSNAAAFCTNFFPVPQKLQSWIDHGELFCEYNSESAFFFRKDSGFWRMYFCAANAGELGRELMALPDVKINSMVMDLIEREAAPDSLLPIMESTGFRLYSRLRRLTRPRSPDLPARSSGDLEPVYAGDEDIQAVSDMLNVSFDRYAEQLPAIYEIEAAINNRQILMIKHVQTLAGLLFFESHGLSSTIRYWVVAEKFRALRYGSALMRAYFAGHAAIQRFNLWVIAGNQPAILRYQHYGYASDKLVDHVLVNEMIRA
jgi:hypothetical protein